MKIFCVFLLGLGAGSLLMLPCAVTFYAGLAVAMAGGFVASTIRA